MRCSGSSTFPVLLEIKIGKYIDDRKLGISVSARRSVCLLTDQRQGFVLVKLLQRFLFKSFGRISVRGKKWREGEKSGVKVGTR